MIIAKFTSISKVDLYLHADSKEIQVYCAETGVKITDITEFGVHIKFSVSEPPRIVIEILLTDHHGEYVLDEEKEQVTRLRKTFIINDIKPAI